MIYIVSGLPRSGTSLAMQMLAAGGTPILSDGLRAADPNNPRGYYEWEPIKQLQREPSLIAQAEDKAVKVISSLLFGLPAGHDYRILFLLRPLDEVVASQAAMISKLRTQGPALAGSQMAAALKGHLAEVSAWLNGQSRVKVHWLQYHDVLRDPHGQADAIGRFLGIPLDTEAMASQADVSLYRQRAGEKKAE
ncbi:MAG TPA: sulfotransferase family protein [Terriglobia bacterium]